MLVIFIFIVLMLFVILPYITGYTNDSTKDSSDTRETDENEEVVDWLAINKRTPLSDEIYVKETETKEVTDISSDNEVNE